MGNLGAQYDQHFWERRPAFVTSASYVNGAHTFKAGFEIRQMKYPNFNFTGSAGNYNIGSNWTEQTSLNGVTTNSGFTGFGFASFLLGGVGGVSLVAGQHAHDRELPERSFSSGQLESQS